MGGTKNKQTNKQTKENKQNVRSGKRTGHCHQRMEPTSGTRQLSNNIQDLTTFNKGSSAAKSCVEKNSQKRPSVRHHMERIHSNIRVNLAISHSEDSWNYYVTSPIASPCHFMSCARLGISFYDLYELIRC